MKLLFIIAMTLGLQATAAEHDLNTIKERYALTDAQVEQLRTANLQGAEAEKVAILSTKSGRPIEDVLRMRGESGRGWGEIAKELGVHPGELGLGHHKDKKEKQADRRASSEARKEDRRDKANKKEHGKGH